jgi:hypothetical protein
MNTGKLAVGQDVCLEAGAYGLDGKVVEVAEWGVYVKTYGSISRRIPSHLLRFDKEGKLLDDVPWYLSPLPTEGGAWCISPLPDGQQTISEQMREYQPFIAWWDNAAYEQRLKVVTKYYTTRLAPPLRANFAPAEEVAKISDISLDSFLMTELAKEV